MISQAACLPKLGGVMLAVMEVVTRVLPRLRVTVLPSKETCKQANPSNECGGSSK